MRRIVIAIITAATLVALLVGPVPVGRLADQTSAQEATPAADAENVVIIGGEQVDCGAPGETIEVEHAEGTAIINCGIATNDPGGATSAAFTSLIFAPGVTLPSPASLLVSRETLAPRAVWRNGSADPTVTLLAVEAGALTVCAAATVELARDGGGQESMPPDTPVVLEPGDLALVPLGAEGELRNDGEEPVVALLTIIAPESGPELVTEDPRRILIEGCG